MYLGVGGVRLLVPRAGVRLACPCESGCLTGLARGAHTGAIRPQTRGGLPPSRPERLKGGQSLTVRRAAWTRGGVVLPRLAGDGWLVGCPPKGDGWAGLSRAGGQGA